MPQATQNLSYRMELNGEEFRKNPDFPCNSMQTLL